LPWQLPQINESTKITKAKIQIKKRIHKNIHKYDKSTDNIKIK